MGNISSNSVLSFLMFSYYILLKIYVLPRYAIVSEVLIQHTYFCQVFLLHPIAFNI